MQHFRASLPRKSIPSNSKEAGKSAEQAVAEYLEMQGLELLGRNVRVGRFEVDLIAREGPVIAIVEVRTRALNAYQRGLDSITREKQARVRKAGERLWRERFSKNTALERMRFDAASVVFSPEGDVQMDYVKAAF